MKRLIAALLLLAILLPFMPAGLAEEPTTISIALWEVDPTFVDANDAVYEFLCDKFNIRIDPIAMTWDDYTEKVNTWVATDDMPDIFNIDMIGNNMKTLNMWVNEELVKPLPEDMSAYPNLQKILSLPDVSMTKMKDRFWSIPRCKADLSGYGWVAQSGCYYRKDWAEQLGLEVPTNLDEFIEFARALVNGDPDGNGVNDTIGMTSFDAGFLVAYIWPAIEKMPFGTWQTDENGDPYVAVNAEHTYEAALLVRQLYNEGIIDPDIAFQDTDAGFNKFASNKAAILPFQLYQNDHYIFDKFSALYPDKKLEDMIGYLLPIPNKYDGNYYYTNMTNYWSEMYISYKVDDAKMEKILQLVDFCASEEYMDIIRFGLEGVDYKREGDEIVFLTEDGQRPNLLQKYPFLNGFSFLSVWNEGQMFFDYATNYPYSAEIINEYFDWVSVNGKPKVVSYDYTMIQTPLRDMYVDQAQELLYQFMFSGSQGDPEAEWQELQDRLAANGLYEMVEEVGQAAREARGE